ncbi:ATP-binding protein [Xanthomonas arboricola]|uniref:ATP-binding protein n=1 Tax=Xanthomonas arboricola TaxID=56448 RepID=UPI000CED977A|nr:ATP-binding protein [Xanthomonas arboricola]PPT46974.1 ATP-binding protein [Xanthomonas arboricola]
MDETQDLFFETRFLDAYAGSIMTDAATAIVELVANGWDAYATEVQILWPDAETERQFVVKDNGRGMTLEDFKFIWRAMSYDRVKRSGLTVEPPFNVDGLPRPVFGRNGKGRFASFCFSSEYLVTSWKDGAKFTCKVKRSPTAPLVIETLEQIETGVEGHGTEIQGCGDIAQIGLDEAGARDIIGSRFLADPGFKVYLNAREISFADISRQSLSTTKLTIPNVGEVTIHHIDARKADKTTKQHGIAWWVQRRAVGDFGWRGSDLDRVLDGRTSEAKRFTFIVEADFLNEANAVKADWSGFEEDNSIWKAVQPLVQRRIRDIIDATNQAARESKRTSVFDRVGGAVNTLPLLGKDRVTTFVNEVVDNCPNFGEQEIVQLTTILTKLEKSKSLYGLLDVLHSQSADDYDALHEVLTAWTIGLAKIVLDEIQTRLRLIDELKQKLDKPGVDEVHELQPLFTKGLWMFGAEFESIEFTSNRGMTNVIQTIFGAKGAKGSRNRPDFVVLDDSSIGLYARSSYDDQSNEDGIEHLVVIDLKTTGLHLGSKEKEQVWRYVKELRALGHLKPTTKVDGFILGDRIETGEAEPRNEGDRVRITPMLYDTIIRRAERRLLNLHSKVQAAPFLEGGQESLGQFLEQVPVHQQQLIDASQ